MSNIPKIHDLLATKPFRPFWIETSGGTHIFIEKAEWYYEPPGKDGEFVVFGEHTHLLNHRDVLDTVTVQNPPVEKIQ
jgi:hypothetical protein